MCRVGDNAIRSSDGIDVELDQFYNEEIVEKLQDGLRTHE